MGKIETKTDPGVANSWEGKKKESFLFYRSWKEGLTELPDKLKLELYDAIVNYALDGEVIELSEQAKTIFSFIKPMIEKDRNKYFDIVESRRKAGAHGAEQRKLKQANEANATDAKQEEANEANATDNDNDNDKENDNDNDNDKENDKENINNDIFNLTETKVSASPKLEKARWIVGYYNVFAAKSKLTKCIKLTDKRLSVITARIEQFGQENVQLAIVKASQSSFCNGNNDRGWVADFDFVFNPNKMAKLIEGGYDDRVSNAVTAEQSRAREAAELTYDLLSEGNAH